jgi:chromosome partitioning protein
MRIISVSNQKGGVGKTTTSVNIAAGLAFMGKKVLLIDLDPQASATILVGVPNSKTMHNVINDEGKVDINSVIQTTEEGFDFIPSSLELANMELFLTSEDGGVLILKSELQSLSGYEYVILDTPPNLGLITLSALVATDLVIIPIKPARLEIEGLKDIRENVLRVKDGLNPNIKYKVLITMHDKRKIISKEFASGIQELTSLPKFKTVINMNTDIEKAQGMGQSVIKYNNKSKGAVAYASLILEIVKEWGKNE